MNADGRDRCAWCDAYAPLGLTVQVKDRVYHRACAEEKFGVMIPADGMPIATAIWTPPEPLKERDSEKVVLRQEGTPSEGLDSAWRAADDALARLATMSEMATKAMAESRRYVDAACSRRLAGDCPTAMPIRISSGIRADAMGAAK